MNIQMNGNQVSDVAMNGNDGKARRWIGPALLISLVLNLFLVALIAASFFMHRPPGRLGAWDPTAVPSPFFKMLHRNSSDLPKEDRAAVRDIMVSEFPSIRPYFLKIEEARLELADVMAVEPYDREKLREVFVRLDTAQADMISATRDAMINGFAEMKPEQRKRIADGIRRIAEKRIERDRQGINAPQPPASEPPQP